MTPKFKIGNPISMDDIEIEEIEEGNLDDMVQEDFTLGETSPFMNDDPYEIEPNILIVKPRIINDRGCETLIKIHENAVFDDVTIENEHDITPSKKVQKFNLSYKYKAGLGKDHMTLAHDSAEFKKAIEVVGSQIPDHRDFDRITYMQIVHYSKDSLFPWHRDMAKNDVGRDYGTCIVQLNDNFAGGHLNVEGCIIPKRAGTMAFFNNPCETWHGVEPIYDGERYVLLIWFGREYESEDTDTREEDEARTGSL